MIIKFIERQSPPPFFFIISEQTLTCDIYIKARLVMTQYICESIHHNASQYHN